MVRVLGPLRVTDGSGSALGPVPAGRATVLLQRLVAARGAFVDVDALIDALWREPPATAERTLAALVSRVRGALGSDIVDGGPSGGYRYHEGTRWSSDLSEIEQLAEEAQRHSDGSPSLSVSAARRGLDLLQSGSVQLPAAFADASWVDDLHRHLAGLARRLRRLQWVAEANLGLWSDLADHAEGALAAEPHDEHAARALMEAQWRLADRGSALRTYDRLRSALSTDLGVEPSPETEELFAAIVRGDGLSTDAFSDVSGGRTGAATAATAPAVRHRELAELVACWSSAAAGQAVVALVTGPPGSGTTHLGQQLAEVVRHTGGRVLRARCFEAERTSVLNPLLAMLSQVLLATPPEALPALVGTWSGTAAELVPELRQAMPVRDYQRASPDLEHRRTLQTLAHVLSRAAARQPTMLLFDDLHHAGTSTVDALRWLLEELAGSPILIVGTADAGDADLESLAADATVVQLGPLTLEEVEGLGAANADEATFVWELTRGHLLFAVEVLAALRRGVPREAIPGSLRSLVLHRVQRHGRDLEELLQVASVIGAAFDLDTLTALCGRPPAELVPLLQTAAVAGLLEPRREQFTFTSPILRDAVYDSMLSPLRLLRHRQLAELFTDRPELRAHHLAAAGRAGEAGAAWFEAATLARRSFANRDAVRLYRAALDAAREAGDVALEGRVLTGRGTAYEELAEYDLAVDDHRTAEALGLATGDRQLRATAVERLGWTAYYRRDVAEAVRRAEQATAMAGTHPSGWALLGRIKHWAGEFDAATTAYTTALEQVGDDDSVRASVLSCLGALLEHRDQYAAATEVLDDTIELCQRIGAFRPLLRTLFFDGLARANAGDLSGALTALETKRALLERYDVSFYRARTNTCLAWVWRELGELGRARALSEQALEQSREVDAGDLQVEQELHALCSLADGDRLEGRGDDAVARLAQAAALTGVWLPFKWRAELRIIELGSRLGADDPEHLLAEARQRGSAKYEAIALHLLGRPEEATRVAEPTGSLLLLAEVAPAGAGQHAAAELEARLPRHLRAGFATRGRLVVQRS